MNQLKRFLRKKMNLALRRRRALGRRLLCIEMLEDRRLLTSNPLSQDFVASLLSDNIITGATIITHGFQPLDDGGDSLMTLATRIRDREDNINGATSDAWLLDSDISSKLGSAAFDGDPSQATLLPTKGAHRSGHVVLQFDWAPSSNVSSAGWGEAAGDALFNMVVGLGIVNPTSSSPTIPLHFIGHSFGTVVTSEAVKRLSTLGVVVDQVTYLDPHDFDEGTIPVDGSQKLYELGLPQKAGNTSLGNLAYGATVWNNVKFTDVYYQTTIIPGVPDGRPIPGAYNVLLDPFALNGHTAVWETFYMNSIATGSTTGYHFSHSVSPVDRPAPIFYADGVTNPQDHKHTPRALFDPTLESPAGIGPTPYGIALLEQLKVDKGAKPNWDPFMVTNGDFENRGLYEQLLSLPNMVPGWSFYGGSGTGRIQPYSSETGNHYLSLNATGDGKYRAHNDVYVPSNAAFLTFDLKRTQAAAGNILEVFLGNTSLGSVALT
ncbi:MAG: hypothetical protein ABL921_35015, partial [Pirellula sp.]